MSWRTVIISKKAKLDLRLGSMVVRGEETKKVHLSEIAVLIIEHTAVSLTAALLCELTKRKVKVIFCDETRNPNSELIPYYGSHDTSAKLRTQINWNQNIKDIIWTAIVREKILQQRDVLLATNKKEAMLLGQYLQEVQLADQTNREGHAAKVYFGAMFGLEHTRNTENPINAALNYGYGLILSAINREIVSNGYVTQLGIHHDNMFNFFNFGSDLMEPFRPLVDHLVYTLDPDRFGKKEKHVLADILNIKVLIDGKEQFLTNAMRIYCKSVFDALNNEDPSVLRFFSYEF